jgi:hypothetical protein
MDVRSGLQGPDMAQYRAQCSVLAPAMLELQVTVLRYFVLRRIRMLKATITFVMCGAVG